MLKVQSYIVQRNPLIGVRGVLFAAGLLSICAAQKGAWAAPAPVAVDSKGRLTIPKSLWLSVGAKKGPDGIVRVQFPSPPGLPRAVDEHGHPLPTSPIKLFVPVRSDGSLKISRTVLPGGRGVLPGAPGTRFTAATDGDGRLVLSLVATGGKAPPRGRK